MIIKFVRYVRIYGFRRTLVKSFGRISSDRNLKKTSTKTPKVNNKMNIGIIGCGQFAVSTIGYFLKKKRGNCIKGCYDLLEKNSHKFAFLYNIPIVYSDANELINDKGINFVYIASNHYSHCDYAIRCLKNGKTIYVEKPVVVNRDQFVLLKKELEEKPDNFYCGYNRPHSPAVKRINRIVKDYHKPFTLSCFVFGHNIPKDNWYRDPIEGTRVCGNLGHWIDLAMHLLFWREQCPKYLKISIAYSDLAVPDDNISLCMVSDKGDLISIILTSRNEPFEGIMEDISLQWGEVNAKICDFRKLYIWKNEKYIFKNFFHKDVGHCNSVMQPFSPQKRNVDEVIYSTDLMLFIKEMALSNIDKSIYEFQKI